MTNRINFHTKHDQPYSDGFRQNDLIRFRGVCIGCGRYTYSFRDADSDPRGPLGLAVADPLEAREYGFPYQPNLPCCWHCHSNDGEKYKRACAVALRLWAAGPMSLACDGGEDEPKICYRLSLGGGGGLFLCESHWRKEARYRIEKNSRNNLTGPDKWDVLPWPALLSR